MSVKAPPTIHLTAAEFTVYSYMCHTERWRTADEIARRVDLSLVTVQEIVKKFYRAGTLTRRKRNWGWENNTLEYGPGNSTGVCRAFIRKYTRGRLTGVEPPHVKVQKALGRGGRKRAIELEQLRKQRESENQNERKTTIETSPDCPPTEGQQI